ncbi:MAG: DnaA/Hda family protein [Planctomycetota bacterium]
MSKTHGGNDGTDVIALFKEALRQRLGDRTFDLWFSQMHFEFRPVDAESQAVDSSASIAVIAPGQFAADRLSKHYLRQMRGAVGSAVGSNARVTVEVAPAKQVELPFEELSSDSDTADGDTAPTVTVQRPPARKKRATTSLGQILKGDVGARRSGASASGAPSPANRRGEPSSARPWSGASSSQPKTNPDLTWEAFVESKSNYFARAACQLAIQDPSKASPLVLWGPAGSGKTHLLQAVAAKLRCVHLMRRVVYLSAEEFTNHFLKALHSNCLPAFRTRFRDVDALLIDDIQFFAEKKATIRELHHTVELLTEIRKPLLFAGPKSPSELQGLSSELVGRLRSGLVCEVETLDLDARSELLRRYAESRCPFPWPEETLTEIARLVDGDGRVLSGVANLVALLQRMNGQMPSLDVIRQHGGHLLRTAGVPITLTAIERAVERVFQLEAKSLQSNSQAKSVTEPRMLAMYLSREMTSSAFSEIGGYFGGRSHSTAILANQRVKQWLEVGKSVGRGRSAFSAEEAIRRIESTLKTG